MAQMGSVGAPWAQQGSVGLSREDLGSTGLSRDSRETLASQGPLGSAGLSGERSAGLSTGHSGGPCGTPWKNFGSAGVRGVAFFLIHHIHTT